MGENTLDNRGQWTGKMDCVAPRRGPMPRRDDANGGGDTTGDDRINITKSLLEGFVKIWGKSEKSN